MQTNLHQPYQEHFKHSKNSSVSEHCLNKKHVPYDSLNDQSYFAAIFNPTFVIAILFIVLGTAVIGDVAGHLGCFIYLKDCVNKIAFVALGTSVPGQYESHRLSKDTTLACWVESSRLNKGIILACYMRTDPQLRSWSQVLQSSMAY